MSVKKFKFVSPGVFLSEIDKSQLPKEPGGIGPVIIGRSQRGPTMKPVKVNSFQEFTEIFGEPVPGGRSPNSDVWRDGNGFMAPTYAAYAAQAYLKAKIDSPVTFIRLAGITGDDASTSAQAGYSVSRAYGIWGTNIADNGNTANCSLLGILYATGSEIQFGVNGIKQDANVVAGVANLYDKVDTGAPDHRPVKINSADHTFRILSKLGSNDVVEKVVSLRRPEGSHGGNFIRDALNTDPTKTNEGIVGTSNPPSANAAHYWLGETFEEEYEKLLKTKVAGQHTLAFITRLDDGLADRKSAQHELRHSSTPWVIPQWKGVFNIAAQTKPETGERLFRIHSVQEGEQSLDLMVEIQNIKLAEPSAIDPYGRFDVVVKQRRNDAIVTLDSFENLNLNPNSGDYIAARIGDQYLKWDQVKKANRVYGDYINQSSFIRVEMNPGLASKGPSDKRSVPFGFLGPVIPKPTAYTGVTNGLLKHDAGAGDPSTWDIDDNAGNAGVNFNDQCVTFNLNWPSPPTTLTASVNAAQAEGEYVMGASPYEHYHGGSHALKNQQNFSNVLDGMRDYYRIFADYPGVVEQQQAGLAGSATKHAYTFTLDDVCIAGAVAPGSDLSEYTPLTIQWKEDSCQAPNEAANKANGHGTPVSYTASGHANGAAELMTIVNSFTMPMIGGSDGVDVREPDPFNASSRDNCVGTKDKTTANSYAYASVDRALNLIKDPETVEMKLATMPGITNKDLTAKLIQTCEARGDALAVVDLPDVFIPESQAFAETYEQRVNNTNPRKSAKALVERRINSSYGCAYYPWVQVRDTLDGSPVWMPPSVVALGAMAYTEQRDEVWFAPAGFNRGGLNEGTAGLPVLQASEQLLSKDRDVLYDANINPIASFVSEGIVIFGQKTLQSTRSALDRINVRRLLIFVKKEVSRISNNLLFDNNLPATWNRFKGLVVPMLESVKTRLGLADFKVVLDETTTTPDLIDRNVMYAKIFLKPARAIEFIAVDFVITRSGASFDD